MLDRALPAGGMGRVLSSPNNRPKSSPLHRREGPLWVLFGVGLKSSSLFATFDLLCETILEDFVSCEA
jgi:hypothetical protein